MGAEVKKGPALALIIFLAMMILYTNTKICRAAAALAAPPPVMKKSSNSSGGGCEGYCLIGDVMDLEEEELLIMDSDISRRMMAGSGPVTGGTKIANSPAVACGAGRAYARCLPDPGMPHHNQHCSTYNRGC